MAGKYNNCQRWMACQVESATVQGIGRFRPCEEAGRLSVREGWATVSFRRLGDCQCEGAARLSLREGWATVRLRRLCDCQCEKAGRLPVWGGWATVSARRLGDCQCEEDGRLSVWGSCATVSARRLGDCQCQGAGRLSLSEYVKHCRKAEILMLNRRAVYARQHRTVNKCSGGSAAGSSGRWSPAVACGTGKKGPACCIDEIKLTNCAELGL
jgi:hypothetical protein